MVSTSCLGVRDERLAECNYWYVWRKHAIRDVEEAFRTLFQRKRASFSFLFFSSSSRARCVNIAATGSDPGSP